MKHLPMLLRRLVALAMATVLPVCALAPTAAAEQVDPASDAPQSRPAVAAADLIEAADHGEALRAWTSVEQVNAWIGARFEYDMDRAMRLSQSQRGSGPGPAILSPAAFFDRPKGVCVDLARFAVETLREIAPETEPQYLMIEFDPVNIRGNTLRRHWLAGFKRGGRFFYFADSKRPGHIAGPYARPADFIAEYARYRGREIVAFRELPTYQRRTRAAPLAQPRQDG